MSDCIEWTGSVHPSGYGRTWVNGVEKGAHRLALEAKIGRKLHKKELACHSCDNRKCVNPDHLWVGSHKDNTHDMMTKGRHRHGPTRGALNPNARLGENEVRRIRLSRLDTTTLARKFGLTYQAIKAIRDRRTWAHVDG